MTFRIDPGTATRDELAAEVRRLEEVNQRWASSWRAIVKANTDAWVEQVTELKARVEMLEGLI